MTALLPVDTLLINRTVASNGGEDSLRMLNVLLPGTTLPVHRHNDTDETVIIPQGRMDEVFYDASGRELERVRLGAGLSYGVQIPRGVYHGVDVFEPTVIVEFKAGAYDPNGTEHYLRPEEKGKVTLFVY